jgi:hypothetical protein
MSIEQSVFQIFKYDQKVTFNEPVFRAFVGSVRLFRVISEIDSDIDMKNLDEARSKLNYLGALLLSNNEDRARDICFRIIGEGVVESLESMLKNATIE